MGLLIDGTWHDQWYDTEATGGRFVRSESQFRHWVTPDGAPGPTGAGGFAAEAGRYHLYVSLACPWAHRTLIFRALKRLDGMIGVSVVNPTMGEHGWSFDPDDGVVPDPVAGAEYLHQVYTRADPRYSGRVTVPVLWDLARNTIVSNESADIIRMLNGAFDGIGAAPGDFHPPPMHQEINALNARIYDTVNNGVYKAGFATTQAAYEAAVLPLFETLDWLDDRLAGSRFLCGDRPTEADWRLFTTLARFDPVYVGHFKCNIRRLVDYRSLWGYARDLYAWPGVRETVNFTHIKRHYYTSHPGINPHRVVPVGPQIDWDAPHARGGAYTRMA
ncbi:MAG: glutathione S-transferase family protein [Janthinobacterium lividum]